MSVYDDIKNLAELDAFFKCERHLFLHNNVMVSISGGSDSDIILDFVLRVLAARKWDYKCKLHFVFFDTGIEYEATKRHLQYLEQKYNITIDRRRAITPVPLGCKKYGVPFLSKYASEMINRLQKHNFDFSRGDRPFGELLAQYPQCKGALRWWCNMNGKDGKKSSFNINRFYMLREFMIENPPDFPISCECCNGAKKNNAKEYEHENDIDLNILGLRKAEGGVRAVAIIYANKGRAKFNPDVPRYDDIWTYARVTGNEQIHQNQKPIPLLMRIIKQHTKPHDLILDPFMGSCSTAVAAHKLQRDFVGFELDKDEYDAGVKRLNAERAQVSIFDIFNF